MEFAMEKYTIIPSLVQVDEGLGQKLPQVRASSATMVMLTQNNLHCSPGNVKLHARYHSRTGAN